MSYYECKRCSYKCNLKSDMKKHLERKNKCHRIPKSYLNAKKRGCELICMLYAMLIE